MKEFRRERATLTAILAASLVLQLVGLALPVSIAITVDHFVSQGRDLVLTLVLGAIVVTGNQVLLSAARERLLLGLRRRLESSFTVRFANHLLSLPLQFFDGRGTGDLLARAASTAQVRDTLSNQVVSALIDGCLVTGYLVILFVYDSTFGFVVLGCLGALVTVMLIVTDRMHFAVQRQMAARGDTQNFLLEAVTGLPTIKAFGRESDAISLWEKRFRAELDQTFSVERLQAVLTTSTGALQVGAGLAFLAFVASRAVAGTMSIGTALALAALGTATISPMVSFCSGVARARRMRGLLERINDVLDERTEAIRTSGYRPDLWSGPIAVERVRFRYGGSASPTLHDVSFNVEAGRMLLIVGPTGSGKSTLAKIITGLYQPENGVVLYAGIEANECDSRFLRRQVGFASQETFLFDATIAENITLFDASIPNEQIERAGRAAELHEEVMSMPLGYSTPVGEGGRGLSGGQRQRVALARALLHEPPVLVLDEATSQVDPVTEQRIAARLRELKVTRVVISHRPHLLWEADEVLVLNGGAVAERGQAQNLVTDSAYVRKLIELSPDSRQESASQRLAG